MASRIEDYGIIGDTRTAALVSRSGSIDWLCFPHFDSDACFAALLGYDRHGQWSIRPTVGIRETAQRYDGDTLILCTEFTCDGGKVRLTDFMPLGNERSDLVRRLEGLEGEVPLEMILEPRFGYGAQRPFVRVLDRNNTTFTAGPDALRLHTDVPLKVADGRVTAYFAVRAGQRMDLQLAWSPSHRPVPRPLDAEQECDRTAGLWKEWADRCTYQGRFREAVVRSLLTLKALTFSPTGAIVAAPTTSLPEEIGGVRNWDYRFCWLRDATLTLHALMFGGYVDEARRFRDWLLRAVAGDPAQTQIMYDIHGGRRLTEFDVPWLPGYEGSRPVHIGNAASEQLQIDVYGEVMSAAYAARRMGLPSAPDAEGPLFELIDHIENIWQEPDDGIWETRGGRKHFTYSKVMAWVAVDRACRLIEEFGVGAARQEPDRLLGLKALRERIHAEVLARGYNPQVGAFTQSYGSSALDASVLLIPHVGFLRADDKRMQGTVAGVERTLLRDGFVLRYATEGKAPDGLPGDEGAFLACSFWLADNYSFAGRNEEAIELFERLLGLRNHLGLLAEEYEPRLGRQLGNFPQGFSHLALMTTARVLEIHTGAEQEEEAAMPREAQEAGFPNPVQP